MLARTFSLATLIHEVDEKVMFGRSFRQTSSSFFLPHVTYQCQR